MNEELAKCFGTGEHSLRFGMPPAARKAPALAPANDQRPVSALENTPPEAARAIFWLFTPKTVLTTITTLGSGEH